MKHKKGFALIEILIAITILAIVFTAIISGVAGGVKAIYRNRSITIAMMIARTELNEFIINDLRGPDISDKDVEGYSGFTYDRETKRFEHELLGPIDAKRVLITVKWQERDVDKQYSLSYIFPVK